METTLSYETIGACLERRAMQSPEWIAVQDGEDSLTWRELNQLSDGLANYFHKIGIQKGTHAAIYCANCISWIAVYMGLQKLGAVTVLLNPGCRPEELQQAFVYADVSYVFFGDNYKNCNLESFLMEALRDIAYQPDHLIGIETAVFQKRMNDILQESIIEKPVTEEPSTAEDIACMLFTSGTTSSPKGVLLSHSNLVNCANATAEAMHWKHTDKVCVMVPLFHCFGMTSCMLASVMVGSTLCLIRRYRSLAALELIQNMGCTVLNGVPSMFLAMINNPEVEHYDLHTLQSGIIAGSSILPEDYMRICEILHMEHLQMSYGQTETSPGVSFSRYDDTLEAKSDNAGVPIPGIQICIWEKDGTQHIYKEEELQNTGVQGELGVRGYIVMQGYYHREEETGKTIQQDGWLHTGDRAWVDEKCQIHVLGRIKEMIIRGGENISPGEIEACIMEIPGISEVKVVGVPHPVLQEEIAAQVVVEPEMIVTEEQIVTHVKKHLAYYKVPTYIKLVSQLPKSASGKIKICEVKEQMTAYTKQINS